MKIYPIIFALIAFFLQGCGGGEDSTDPAVPLDPIQSDPIRVKATSYSNFKEIGLTPQNLPDTRRTVSTYKSFADFRARGRRDMFAITFNSPWPPTTPDEQVPGIMEFWEKQANGSYSKRDDFFENSNDGCTHPRKTLVADFNQDQIPDVFVACTGFDADPFPGETNKVILSQPSGKFLIQDASDDVGFFHAAAVFDFNSDSHPDVLVINSNDSQTPFVLINDGLGGFTKETITRLPRLFGQYYTAEVMDVDGDATQDIVFGGHEYSGANTIVLLNPGSNDFSDVEPIVIPAVQNEGTVLDFTITSKNSERILWVLRTSGGDGTFYNSRVIQKVLWPSLSSSVVLNERPKQWVPWLIPTVVDGMDVIATESHTDGISIPY